MLITKYQTFVTATDKDWKLLPRGSNIRAVDRALEGYWRAMKGAPNAKAEIGCLSEIVEACLGWLKLQRGRAEDLQAEIGPLFVRRRQAIANLGSEALQELYARLTELDMLTPDRRGRLTFDRRKLSVLGSGANHGARSPYVRELRARTIKTNVCPTCSRASARQSRAAVSITHTGISRRSCLAIRDGANHWWSLARKMCTR